MSILTLFGLKLQEDDYEKDPITNFHASSNSLRRWGETVVPRLLGQLMMEVGRQKK